MVFAGLSDLKDEIRKSIESVKSNRWTNVIKTCSDDDYRKITEERESGDSNQTKRKPNTPKVDDDNDENSDRSDIDRNKNSYKRHDLTIKEKKESETDVDTDYETIKNDDNRKSKPKVVNKTDNDDDDSDDRNDEPDSPKNTKTNDAVKQKTPEPKKVSDSIV